MEHLRGGIIAKPLVGGTKTAPYTSRRGKFGTRGEGEGLGIYYRLDQWPRGYRRDKIKGRVLSYLHRPQSCGGGGVGEPRKQTRRGTCERVFSKGSLGT